MTTVLVVLFVLAIVIYFLNLKVMAAPSPLLKATKKVEATIVKAIDVNGDGKVNLADAVAAAKAVEKTGKVVVTAVKKTGKSVAKKAKKITTTKKKTK
jgi:ABC-type uncharacterized transport system ATPase component